MANQHTKVYSETEREEALALMAVHNGSRVKASELTGIPEDTLSSWAYSTHNKKYRELRLKAKTEIGEATMETLLRRAEEAGDAADILRARMMLPKNLDEIPARELPGAFRNAVTGAGIYLTNAAKLIESTRDSANININFSMADLVRNVGTQHGGRFTDEKGNPLSVDEAVQLAKGAIEGTATEVKDDD